jgi:hypothetical protein
MEFSRRALIVERVLAAVLLAAALGAAWAESGAPLSACLRDGRPWLAWVEARESGRASPPSLSLAVYEPVPRRLTVLHVPGETKLEGRRTLERAYLEALKAKGDLDDAARAAEDLAEARLRELSPEPIGPVSGRLEVEVAPLSDDDEPAVETALALKALVRRPRAWLSMARRAARGLRAGDRGALDPLLFALELRRVRLEDISPARLPDETLAPELLGRVLAASERADDGRATTVEVLNGVGIPGLASRAVKVLRSKGVDVLTTAGTRPRARTLVYDRVGDFRRAEKIRSLLGCPAARAVIRADPSRAVDVSIELGADCAGAFESGGGREP